ncbi:MAG: M23 family metallopeptidase [Bacteroidales bacterium]|jgi:murein DD-endopeptidase MepM/ murein hydrolase activator NlpD
MGYVEGIISVVFDGPNPIHECGSHDEYYYLILTANPSVGGSVTGGGNYPNGSSVYILASSNSGFKFVNWTGSTTISTIFATVTVDSTMYFTANFRPCYTTNKANPLPHMELAPPNTDNIAGATFGKTRVNKDGDSTDHWGIDLEGAVGTPIYAQFDGTIAKPPVTGQPNRVAGYYPSGYSDDKDDGGNRIYVESNIGGNTVRNGYMHLQAGNPAINPRTLQPFKEGNSVIAGDVIGYIGLTGNASASRPHLHLKTTVNGAPVDPALYFNATISLTITTITTPCD